MRGVAALIVAFGHSMTVLTYGQVSSLSHIESIPAFFFVLLFQQNSAVILFYILSGFVLSLTLERNGDYAKFLISRILRIMPMAIVSVLVVGAYMSIPRVDLPNATGWFNTLLPKEADYLANLTLFKTDMNGVLWSIKVELLIAPFIPLFYWIAKRTDRHILIVCGLALLNLAFPPQHVASIAYCFYLGIVATRIRFAWPLWASIVAVFAAELLWHAHMNERTIAVKFFIDAIASAHLIASVVRGDHAWLENRWLVFMGSISYSFYVLHTVFMDFAARHVPTGHWSSMLLIGLVSSVACIAVATLSHRWIEQPCRHLSAISWLSRFRLTARQT